MSSARSRTASVAVLVYSDDAAVRERIRTAVGGRPAADVGPVSYVEAADHDSVVAAVDAGGVDLLILDGEAWPTGGMGLARELKDEVAGCPPIVVVVGRAADAWLATWARADAVLSHPLDPMDTGRAVAELLRALPVPPPMSGRDASVR